MVLFITGLLLLLTLLVIFILASHASTLQQQQHTRLLEQELTAARSRLASAEELNQELEQMRSLQERLLVMLGVQRPAVAEGDSLLAAWTAGGQAGGGAARGGGTTGSATLSGEDTATTLERVAALVMTPPPDLWPVSGYVTREFREGDSPRGIMPHHGIDIAGPEGSSLVAAGKGRVLKASWDDYLGNFVEIQHGFGYVTVYGHCSRLAVKEGDRIDRGQVIGYLGSTGQASAPHLHFEVWKDGEVVDPRQVLPGEPPR
jgi:murein DD-endopeptidase MepM/ murein hydrolase activator NlpD